MAVRVTGLPVSMVTEPLLLMRVECYQVKLCQRWPYVVLFLGSIVIIKCIFYKIL